jgi:hypothetical protein
LGVDSDDGDGDGDDDDGDEIGASDGAGGAGGAGSVLGISEVCGCSIVGDFDTVGLSISLSPLFSSLIPASTLIAGVAVSCELILFPSAGDDVENGLVVDVVVAAVVDSVLMRFSRG